MIDYKDFHNFFAQTKYGKILKKNIRWHFYKPEKFCRRRWIRTLGPDANNLDHALVMYKLVDDFIKSEKNITLKKIEKNFLLLAAIIHDWAESVYGDIVYDQKTKADTKKEHKKILEISTEISKKYKNNILKDDIIEANKVVNKKNKKLGSIFNLLEKIGYLETSLIAWQKINTEKKIEYNLKWLIHNAFICQIEILLESKKKYSTISDFFKKNQKEINNILENLTQDEELKKYPQPKIKKAKKITEIKKIFQKHYPPKKIIAIIGMAGSGKSEAVKILEKKFKYPKIYFGQVVMNELKRKKLKINPQNERKTREALRKKYGMGVCAIKSLAEIEKKLENNNTIIIESLYSFEEYKIIKNKYQDNFKTITIYTSPEERFNRLKNRKFRPITKKSDFDMRDYSEIENLQKGGPIAISNFTIINESNMKDLEKEMTKIIKNNFS